MVTGIIDLGGVQRKHREWCDKNFPNDGEVGSDRALQLAVLGVCEEAGELAHATLKRAQQIRGTEEEHLAYAKDAVGDICIYLMSVCDHLGLDMADVIKETWAEVQTRNWLANPHDGSTEKKLCPVNYFPNVKEGEGIACLLEEGHEGLHSWERT